MKIRIGTRGSPLALWQANWVAARLRELAGVDVEIIEIRTEGDERRESIAGLNSQGVFTKEIQRALLDHQVDLAVHSLKDLPTEPTPGLVLAAVPQREQCGDTLISRDGASFDQLKVGAVIGTGSARRRAQLLSARPDLVMADVRGNVDTRLRKLREGQYDALVLAQAGLLRLGLADQITEVLPKSLILPAVGQGALGLETREDDVATRAALEPLDDAVTHRCVLAERSLLAALRGGCLAPVGAWARVEDNALRLSAVVLSVDGRARLVAELAGVLDEPIQLGERAAGDLIEQGAAALIAASRTG